MFRRWVTVMLALVMFSPANPAWAEWRVSSGVYLSGGDYGRDQDTRIRILSQGLQWRGRDYSLKLAVPWLFIDGPGDLTLAGNRTGGDPVSGLAWLHTQWTRLAGGQSDRVEFLIPEWLRDAPRGVPECRAV